MKCMETNFGGRGFYSFGDFATFSFAFKMAKLPFRPWTIVHEGQKIKSAQKIHAGRGCCEMHGNQFW